MQNLKSWLAALCIASLSVCGLAQEAMAVQHKPVAEPPGHPNGSRLLLIQAEDLSMAHSVDKAAFEALENGWATTANVLIPGPWFPEVLRWARDHPNADLGVQIDLNSDWSSYRWRPLSPLPPGSGLTDGGGYLPSTELDVARNAKEEQVEAEAKAQIELAKKVRLQISHLDTHMHTMLVTPALFQTYWKMGQEFQLPLVLPRQFVEARGRATQKPGVYDLAGVEVDIQTIPIDREIEIMPGFPKEDWLHAYESALGSLPPGVYLLSVHLGYNDEELQAMTWDHPNWGAQWRQNDLDVVSSSEFHKFLKDKGFILVNWKDLQKVLKKSH